MKKRLFMIGAVLSASAAVIAQTDALPSYSFEQNIKPLVSESEGGLRYNGEDPLLDNPVEKDTLWYSDFSDLGDWTINNQGSLGWNINSTNEGWFYPNAISSTSGGNFAEMNNGNPLSGNVSSAQHILTSDNIDVSNAEGGGFIMYQERASRFFDEMYIEASSDGSSWTTVGRNEHLLPRTDDNNTPGSLTDPEYVGYYIPESVMTATGDLYVRFRWIDQNSGVNAGNAYGWMIDDVVIYNAPGYDLDLVSAHNFGAGDTNASIKYTMIPEEQAANATFRPAARIGAEGDSTHTGIALSVIESNTGYSSESDTFSLERGESNFVETNSDFTTNGIGSYNMTYEMTSDQKDRVEANGVMSWEFEVTQNEFAYDDADFQGFGVWGTSGALYCVNYDNFTESEVIGVRGYFPMANAVITGDVGLSYGDVVRGAIYTIDGNNFTEFGESVFHTISGGSGFVDGWVDVPMNHTIPVSVNSYFACVGVLREGIPIAYDYGVSGFALVDPDNQGSFLTPVTNPYDTFNVMPFIRVKTFSEDLCNGRTINVDIGDDCNSDAATATLTANVSSTGPSGFTYEWSNDGDADTISIDVEGTYSVTVTDGDACTGEATIDYTNDEFICNLSVDEIDNSKAQFSVVPNPNNGTFNLVFGNTTSDAVEIIVQSLKGEVLYSNVSNVNSASNVEVNLSDVASGVYLVKVINEEATNVERIVIK